MVKKQLASPDVGISITNQITETTRMKSPQEEKTVQKNL
jgi:hypothetical protein